MTDNKPIKDIVSEFIIGVDRGLTLDMKLRQYRILRVSENSFSLRVSDGKGPYKNFPEIYNGTQIIQLVVDLQRMNNELLNNEMILLK